MPWILWGHKVALLLNAYTWKWKAPFLNRSCISLVPGQVQCRIFCNLMVLVCLTKNCAEVVVWAEKCRGWATELSTSLEALGEKERTLSDAILRKHWAKLSSEIHRNRLHNLLQRFNSGQYRYTWTKSHQDVGYLKEVIFIFLCIFINGLS